MRRTLVMSVLIAVAWAGIVHGGEASLVGRADAAFAAKKYDKAAKLYNECMDEYVMSENIVDRAQFMEAEATYLAGRLSPAYRLYEQYLEDHPRTGRFEDVLAREYAIGERFCDGYRRSFLYMRIIPGGGLGVEILEQVIRHAPRGPYGDKSLMRIAYYHDKSGYYGEARTHYQMLLDEYPESEYAPMARLLKAQAARKEITGARYNVDGLEKAEQELLKAKAVDKGKRTESEIDRTLARLRDEQLEGDYETAKFYLRQGYPGPAAMCFNLLIKKAPDSRYARYSQAALNVLVPAGVKKQ